MVSQNLYFRDGNKLNLQPMEKSELYDYRIVNDDLQTALQKLGDIIKSNV